MAEEKKYTGRGIPFPKGVSGNPKGRPKGKLFLSEILNRRLKLLAKKVPWAADKLKELELDPKSTTIAELVVDTAIISAMNGDPVPFREIWDRNDGKQATATDITSGGKPVSLAPIRLDGEREL